ncbi:MAG: molybdate ABC transporter substrate-binding protein, partial [Chloroflexi bacterium]|nr:molybdate ABC transporter substrate-binding protein [Chloroflexota bacterium]
GFLGRMAPVSRRSLAVLLLPAVLLLTACGGGGDRESVHVFAASSLQDVLPVVLAGFERGHPGVVLSYQFAGSQTLATQIEEGARADIFISANPDQAERLLARGHATEAATLIENELVIAARADSGIASLDHLGRPGVRIAIGAPDVPIGQLTQRTLELMEPTLTAAIRGNVVTEDPNVRVVLSRVELGEADAAFVYRTDLAAAPAAIAIALPPSLHVPSNRYVIVLTGASSTAASVFDYLLGADAQQAFAAAGFIPAADATVTAAPRVMGSGSNGAR